MATTTLPPFVLPPIETDDVDVPGFPTFDSDSIPLPTPTRDLSIVTTIPFTRTTSTTSSSSTLTTEPFSSAPVSSTSLTDNLQATTPVPTQKSDSQVGIIVGVVIGVLCFFGLSLFFLRLWFIRERKAHAGASITRARIANISAPTNFVHLENGTLGRQGDIDVIKPPPPPPMSKMDSIISALQHETPSETIRQKYAMEDTNADSGRSYQAETMKPHRKPPPSL